MRSYESSLFIFQNVSYSAFLLRFQKSKYVSDRQTLLLSQEHDIESLIRHLEAIENASTGTLTNVPMTLKFNAVPFQRKHGKVYKDSVVINAYPDTLSNDFDAEIYRSQLSEIYAFGIFDSSVSSTNALQQEAEEYYEL